MTAERDRRFDALWRRRADLGQAEWAELWGIVNQVLLRGHFSELESLPDEREEYIAGFFTTKVFEAGQSATVDPGAPSVHTGLLVVAFRRYLIDQIRAHTRRGKGEEDRFDDEEDAPTRTLSAIPGQSSLLGGHDIDQGDSIPLDDAGLDEDAVRASAARWLDRQEDWVTLYLGLHHCPCGEASLPLMHLAARYGISSYHPRARKLGITYRKQDRRKPWFRNTLLGQWLERELGLPIDAEQASALALALNLLCDVAMRKARALQNAAPADVDDLDTHDSRESTL